MIHVYVVKTELRGTLPEGTIHVEVPEHESHKAWSETVQFPYARLDANGWSAVIRKGKRACTDGSGNVAGALEKIERLCGVGDPIRERSKADVVVTEYKSVVIKLIVKSGKKAKDVGKLGKTVEEVSAAGKKYGLSQKVLTSALKRARAIAELKSEPIGE